MNKSKIHKLDPTFYRSLEEFQKVERIICELEEEAEFRNKKIGWLIITKTKLEQARSKAVNGVTNAVYQYEQQKLELIQQAEHI